MKKNFSFSLFKSYSLTSQQVILIATLYFGFILNLSFWRYVLTHVDISNLKVALFVFSLPFFILCPLFWIFNLLLLPKIIKPILIFFLMSASIANYLMFQYGIYIDSEMIQNAFETNTREALDLVTLTGILFVCVTGLIPTLFLLKTHICFATFKKELFCRIKKVLISILIILCFAVTSYKEYAAFGRNNRQIKNLINVSNYTYGTFRYFQKKALANKKFTWLDPAAKADPYPDAKKTVLIIILGETARAQNFSLYGYERETNPLLKKQDIVTFKDVESCGTATATSVPCLFSHMTRETFDVNEARISENLLDLLQKGEYDIIWRENDDGCKSVCNRVQTEHTTPNKQSPYCFKDYCYDEVLTENLEDILKNIKRNTVIILHAMGSHGPTYYNRYPEQFKVFQPTCDTADIQNCSLESIINTYDNTILYTDFIISSSINILKKFPSYESGLVYISDHGESLGENGIYLHGFPFKIAPNEQKKVPFIMWMSENMKKYDHIDYTCLKKSAASTSYSHDYFFHSILGLLEVNSKLYDKNYDIFNSCRTKELPF